jgi:hypothetical protein
MGALLDRFSSERNAFVRLKKLCESKVVRWEYWDWPEWHWEPDYFLEARQKPKRVKKDQAEFGYGLDRNNRVVLVHKFEFGDPEEVHAMYFLRYSGNKLIGSEFLGATVYEGNKVLGADFERGGSVIDVFQATLSDSRIVRVERLHSGFPQWDWKTITWKGDKVATILEGVRGRKPHRQKTYNDAGCIIEDLDLSKPVKRQPLPKGVTMKSLAKEIRDRLAKAVVATVSKAKVKQPVYCLVLNYDCEGNPLLLPELGIGLDSDRHARLKRGGRDAKLDIWDPEEFPIYANNRTALKDKALEQACDLYNRELEYQGSDEPARKLILQVAADLAKVNWDGKLQTTDDFIVYAVDTDGVDFRKNLKLTVPPKQLAKLKAAKLI